MKRHLLGVLLLSGCTDVVQHGALVELSVTRSACDGSDLAPGATHWRLRVLQDGRLFSEKTGPTSQVVPAYLTAPEDSAMAVRLELFDDAGQVVAWGQSRTLAPEEQSGARLSIALAPTERFVDTCARLGTARAGHTATLLGNGRVLIAAGHGGGSAPHALSSLEELDVTTRTSADSGSLGLTVNGSPFTFATADHAAVALGPTQVLLWGGWRDGTQLRVPQTLIVVWDTEVRQLGAYPVGTLPSVARFGHALVKNDSVVFALGGTTRVASEVPAAQVERLDVSVGRRSMPGSISQALEGTAISGLGRHALVAGGRLEDGSVSGRLELLSLGEAVASVWTRTLVQARADATAVPLGDGVLIAGGVDGQGTALGSTEWLRSASANSLVPGPDLSPRASACAAALGDGRVLLVGGVAGGQASSSAEVVDPTGVARAVAFPGAARHGHACATLADGSVLVVGGLTSSGEALGDAWRYVPSPPPLLP